MILKWKKKYLLLSHDNLVQLYLREHDPDTLKHFPLTNLNPETHVWHSLEILAVKQKSVTYDEETQVAFSSISTYPIF